MNSESLPEPVHIDKVRASREGHTYHDTWTARVALELLVPTASLQAKIQIGLVATPRLDDRHKASPPNPSESICNRVTLLFALNLF
ncbi:MAG TPA: hypothetical protein VGQ81_13945, partial [Acidobacteriota bacterium]|nr:hypothetical protein [Acidobacteriota bacterium]